MKIESTELPSERLFGLGQPHLSGGVQNSNEKSSCEFGSEFRAWQDPRTSWICNGRTRFGSGGDV